MKWKPIETAPKCGMPVLLHAAEIRAGRYWNRPLCVRGNADDIRTVEWMSLGGTYEEIYKPTHWMPLPEPPNAG